MAEVTWAGGALEELALRTARAAGDRRDEFVARLPLTDPAARAAAREGCARAVTGWRRSRR